MAVSLCRATTQVLENTRRVTSSRTGTNTRTVISVSHKLHQLRWYDASGIRLNRNR